jgi:hypothetical protein
MNGTRGLQPMHENVQMQELRVAQRSRRDRAERAAIPPGKACDRLLLPADRRDVQLARRPLGAQPARPPNPQARQLTVLEH